MYIHDFYSLKQLFTFQERTLPEDIAMKKHEKRDKINHGLKKTLSTL